MIQAEIVAHSLSPQGDELVSVLCTFPRIILAEVNTHRMLSKNTSSSRAIPFNKMVEAVQNNPFIPIAFQKEHKGMQGNEYHLNPEVQIKTWLEAKDYAIRIASNLNNQDCNVTKQLCNRLLEPFMWTTMLITGSREGWENFFNLRCPQYHSPVDTYFRHKSKKDCIAAHSNPENLALMDSFTDVDWLKINEGQAEIHIMALAECIWDAVNESVPKQLQAGEWHIPFENKIEEKDVVKYIRGETDVRKDGFWGDELIQHIKVKISTAMAAHTSYTTVGNEPVKTYEDWIKLHNKLVAYDPPHSSPMEHCARAMSGEEYYTFAKSIGYKDNNTTIKEEKGWCYNLKGFISYRYMIDNNIEL